MSAQAAEPVDGSTGPLLGVPQVPTPEYLPPQTPGAPFDLPPVPTEVLPATVGENRFLLKGVSFSGNRKFTDSQLQEVAAPFLNRPVGMADLEAIRFRLTKKYLDAGYVTSGAILPDQHISGGLVRYQIVEGRLTEVRVRGNERLRPEYIENRLRLDPDEALNTQVLQDRFQMLLSDPLIDRLNGALHPGVARGEAILDLDVTRAKPYQFSLFVDNHRPPSTGSVEVGIRGNLFNLTGYGDTFSFEADKSEGADNLYAGFSIPVTAKGLRLLASYQDVESSVIEESLQAADIESEFRDISFGLSYPLINRMERKLTLGAVMAIRRSRTFLLGEPVPFAAGVEDDGTARTSILRLSQEYVQRGADQVMAARSTFNLGVDAFDATVHDDLPDSDFLTWTGQLRYAHRFPSLGSQVILRGVLQIASTDLLPQERIAVGGWNSVRGYRENELVRDNGYAASIEYRLRLLGDTQEADGGNLQLALFADTGSGWNKSRWEEKNTLMSMGVGLVWAHGPLKGDLYYAHPLKSRPEKPDYDLQDDGIHFQLTANLE